MTDLVSIITPCYNSEKYISGAINSVIAQTYTDWEMIIVDDCSTDNSIEIIKSFMKKDSRITLIELDQNSGAGVARNHAIDRAKGKYIAFLDSDDLWLPQKLEKQLDFMNTDNYDFCYSGYYISKNKKKLSIHSPSLIISYSKLLATCDIGCLTVIYNAHSIGKFYMPILTKAEDYLTWLKIIKKTKYAYGIKEPLAIYRINKEGLSHNKFNALKKQWICYRNYENLTIGQSSFYTLSYIFWGIIKRIKVSFASREYNMPENIKSLF